MFENEEKTEKPSKRKLQKEREKGNVPKSPELSFALCLFVSLMFLATLTQFFSFKKIFYLIFGQLNSLTVGSALNIAFSFWNTLLLFLILVFIAILAANFLQTGWIWITKKEKGKRSRKSRLFYPFLKMSAALLITYWVIQSVKPLNKWIFSTSREKAHLLMSKLFWFLIFISLAFLVLGIFDLLYQRWLFMKKMRMTKAEVKEEKREEELDENIKSKQKEKRY